MNNISYDDETDELVFPDGKRVYAFGGNPGISINREETLGYSHGSDGGFYVEDIGVTNAILLADQMIETWKRHKAYLETLKCN